MQRSATSSAVHGRRGRLVGLLVPLLIPSLLAGCGGGNPVQANGGGPGTITGLAVKGPIQAATVTAYPLDASMNRGAALANAPTGPDGTFTLSVPPYNGALELVAFGGTYPEEAVGVPVQLTHELSIVVPGFQSGASVSVTISPMSSVARSLAKAAIARGSSLTDAVAEAWTHVNNHFGGLDWRTIRPTSLTPSQPTTVTMSDATKAGLILAGLSQAARTMAESSSLSPGTSVTGGTLSGAGADDALDGTLDGSASSTALLQGNVALTSYTFRRVLGQGIIKFVGTAYNKTQLVVADVLSLASALAADSDPYLFCPSQTAAPSCAGGSLELQPPMITFVTPPTFVNSTTVSLRVQAADPLAAVTAVYAQTVAGAPIAGAPADGVWTVSNIPLGEGPNLIFVWGVDAAGTGSIADAAQITVTRDTLAPGPYVNTTAVAYYDERAMTLPSATIPAVYEFPAGATKVAPIPAAGVWKAATRLGWNTQPTPSLLEGTNPDNIPFIQIALPVSSGWSPTASGTFSIDIGGTVVTGDLIPWKSDSSTATTEYYDVPLSSNVAPAFATRTSAPLTVTVGAEFTDAAGNMGSTSVTLPPFHVIGPPVFVAQDTAYPTYNDVRGTFAYSLTAGSSSSSGYWQLWNTAAGNPFYGGQVRLVRYVLSNPAPNPVAIAAATVQDPSGSWRARETWTPFDAGPYFTWTYLNLYAGTVGQGSYSFDGQTFYDPTYFKRGSGCSGCSVIESGAYPCTTPGQTLLAHVAGSGARWSCIADSYYSSPTNSVGTSSASDVSASVFVGPQQGGGEVVVPPTAASGSMYIIPAANGTNPGTLVLYLTRPVAAGRASDRPVSWNTLTASNRYEVHDRDFFPYWGTLDNARFGYSLDGFKATKGGIFLGAAEEHVYATLNLRTAGLTGGSTVIGEVQQQFSTTLAGPIGSH
jgi:hypothetical protein